ncbi:class I SAM-dependent methyltransferase [Litoribrevibacter euphylliae]|uniref:Ribosomal RNA small subunit methyltransferase J n=1 Tax=Litoribrevibacter euphylliae TaxID=1834034 RepID=A0ABV7HGL4_9GAMM
MSNAFKLKQEQVQAALIVLYAPHRETQAKAFVEHFCEQLGDQCSEKTNAQSFVIRPKQKLDLTSLDSDAHIALVFDEEVYLQAVGPKPPGPVSVAFEGNAMIHRLKHGGGKGEQVAKAVGLGKVPQDRQLTVLDATAGLGRDALILAALGCKLDLYERNPVVRELLKDGLERASLVSDVADVTSRMSLNGEDFITVGDSLESESYDVVYLDPMFPDRSKSALVKKEMRVFKQLIGGDEDADALFEPAYRLAKHRVVVKRPKAAPFLAGKTPSLQLKGKSGRFDIYTKKAF